MGARLIGMSEDSQRSAGMSEDDLAFINDPIVPPAIRSSFLDLEAREHRERLRTMRALLLRNRIGLPAEIIDAAQARVAEMLRGNDPKSLREALRFVKDAAVHDLNVDKALMEVVTQERDAQPAGEISQSDLRHIVNEARRRAEKSALDRYGPPPPRPLPPISGRVEKGSTAEADGAESRP